jgi:hypothetical protein
MDDPKVVSAAGLQTIAGVEYIFAEPASRS